ncbi:phosphatase PAP2 family protein [Conservatibacter flavescens]|uniref:undecaprenyl-diphosphate phosphatase n=1 Tax=Conservatibacter flavescens TaxID=28161 RepID=A0A2M8S656_9PAST|nr:phosphatase PAP2 family protein [Conservatibacter flavescens]PJG86608.1 phosphatidylglycerophosphatase [Conservatibacter flavescens]
MLKRLSLYTLLLCLVPFFLWIFTPATELVQWDYILYWITETGSMPYGIGFSVILLFILCVSVSQPHQWKRISIVCICSLLLTQGVKSILKETYTEPRPYVTELALLSNTLPTDFYQQSRKERAEIVENFYLENPIVPTWLAEHRKSEVGYSFPSGHTIFAATWLMLFVGFSTLYGQKSRVLVPLMAVWALCMSISRVRLGMHYPIDLLASVLIAFIIHSIIFYWLEKRQSAT